MNSKTNWYNICFVLYDRVECPDGKSIAVNGVGAMAVANSREPLPEFESKSNTVILDSIADGVFTVDGEWCITFFNRAAERIVGIPREKALGKHCWDVFKGSSCERECVLRESIKADQPFNNRLVYIIDSLQRNDWNRNAFARELGIHRSTLFRKLKLLGIEAPPRDEGNPS